jgi:hypothetical protein
MLSNWSMRLRDSNFSFLLYVSNSILLSLNVFAIKVTVVVFPAPGTAIIFALFPRAKLSTANFCFSEGESYNCFCCYYRGGGDCFFCVFVTVVVGGCYCGGGG